MLSVGDGIARVYGLEKVMALELVEFPGAIMGLVLNLEEDNVGVAIMGEDIHIKEGDIIKRNRPNRRSPRRGSRIGARDFIGGRTAGRQRPHRRQRVPPGGNGGAGCYCTKERARTLLYRFESHRRHDPHRQRTAGTDHRRPSDRQNPPAPSTPSSPRRKRTFTASTLPADKRSPTVAQVHAVLEKYGAMEYTTIIAACASDPATLQYIGPYAGCAMGEYFRDNKQHALIIYDDLSKQAVAYRQVSLLLRRPPGREAFPGDIFYNHSRLLERSAKLSDELGAGSLTALPIIETQAGDVSAFIPTNVISITDGQVYLEPGLFFAGVRPAINVGLSVSPASAVPPRSRP